MQSIADALLWPDSTRAHCPWCAADAVMVHKDVYDGNVFECANCQRMFRSDGILASSSFLDFAQSAVFSPYGTPMVGPDLGNAALECNHARLSDWCRPRREVSVKWSGPSTRTSLRTEAVGANAAATSSTSLVM